MPQDEHSVIFRLRGVARVYHTGGADIHALRGIDLTLFSGEFVVLLGASGSGKSTLLNILGGLDKASDGEIWYHQQNLGLADDRALTAYRRHKVGFVFQFYNLIPSLTALENIKIVTEIVASPMAAEEALRLVGLSERKDHFPAQLSGGEQQRVAIARAIAKNPEVLLCDEPTGALDSETGSRVLEVLADINRRLGTTTVVITHNAVIAEMADRLVRIGDGKIQAIHRNEHKQNPRDLRW